MAAVLPTTALVMGQNVVTDWNTIASATIVAKGGNGPGVVCV
jgi:hypothetical protein